MRQIALQKATFYQAKGRVSRSETRPFAFMPIMYGVSIYSLANQHNAITKENTDAGAHSATMFKFHKTQQKQRSPEHVIIYRNGLNRWANQPTNFFHGERHLSHTSSVNLNESALSLSNMSLSSFVVQGSTITAFSS